MSDANQHEAPGMPDYVEPALGFRIWSLRGDALHGAAYPQLWKPGENAATCGEHSHPAPAQRCRCGFNALHDLAPAASSYGGGYVAGAIAAWGEIELHRTGLRAEHACVLALCFEAGDSAERRGTIERVARAYGVEAVPRIRLREHASQFASSLDPRKQKPRHTSAPTIHPDKLRTVGGGRGHWVGRHVLVDWWGGNVSTGAASALAGRVGADARLLTVAPGAEVAEGDAVAVLHTGSGSFTVASPAAGRITAVNEEVLRDPGLAAVEPSEGGWLVQLRPAAALLDECPLVWGRRGREQYDAFIARVGRERALDDISLSQHLAGERIACAEDAVSLIRRRLRGQAARHARRLQAA